VIYLKRSIYVLAVQNEAILTTSKVKENDIQHASQTISQLDFHSNDEEINTNSKGDLFYF